MHEAYLRFAHFRYLKVALALVAAAGLVYALFTPARGASGDTWVGYGLGTLSALLMLWLMWLGVRKRRYGARGRPLREWVSAHVYLGLALVALVPLHAGFQVGWNVHTLSFALTYAVIATGIAGVVLYALVPTWMTKNRPGEKVEGLLERIAQLDAQSRAAAAGLPDVFAQAVLESIGETRIGGGLRAQLAGGDRSRGAERALRIVREHFDEKSAETREDVRRLLELLATKVELVRTMHRDVRYQALFDLWLVLHVPLAFAAIAAVAAHVFVVFYYR